MAYSWLNSIGSYTLTTSSISYANLPLEPSTSNFTLGSVISTVNGVTTFNISADMNITFNISNNMSQFNTYVRDIPNSANIFNTTWGGRQADLVGIMVAIDETNQKADVVWICHYVEFPNMYRMFKVNADANVQSRFYQLIQGAIPPLYNWQSVPAISGKNGILNLSTLNDINDGEPVETSDTSKFNLTDDSNVSALVAAHFSE